MKMTVRSFMLKKFPTDKYMDCPVPKHYWEIIQEYAELYASIKDIEKLIEWTDWLSEMGWYKEGNHWEHNDEIGIFETTSDLVRHYNPTSKDDDLDYLRKCPSFINEVSDDEFSKKLHDDIYNLIADNIGNIIIAPTVKSIIQVAKQYSNAKLDELEKWCDKNYLVSVKLLKAKIKTLK
jgi:hypothetical protein